MYSRVTPTWYKIILPEDFSDKELRSLINRDSSLVEVADDKKSVKLYIYDPGLEVSIEPFISRRWTWDWDNKIIEIKDLIEPKKRVKIPSKKIILNKTT